MYHFNIPLSQLKFLKIDITVVTNGLSSLSCGCVKNEAQNNPQTDKLFASISFNDTMLLDPLYLFYFDC